MGTIENGMGHVWESTKNIARPAPWKKNSSIATNIADQSSDLLMRVGNEGIRLPALAAGFVIGKIAGATRSMIAGTLGLAWSAVKNTPFIPTGISNASQGVPNRVASPHVAPSPVQLDLRRPSDHGIGTRP